MIGMDVATKKMLSAKLPLAWAKLLLLLAVSASALRYAHAQQPSGGRDLVADVLIVGAKQVPPEKVQQYIHTKPGMPYSAARSFDDVNRLSEARLFKSVQVRTEATPDGRLNVIYVVTEHLNLVKEVKYLHAKHVNEKDLDGLTRIRKGMPLDRTLNLLACTEIQEHLKRKGYMLANVTLVEGFDESHDRVVFNITEGELVKVRNVTFSGQSELATASRLRTQTDTTRSIFGLGGTYTPELVDLDRQKIEEYYRSNGFLNVRVSREINLSDDLKFVDINYHLLEGPRYRLKDVTVEGTKTFSSQELSQVMQAKRDEYYNEGKIGGDVRNLTDYGGWRGNLLNVQKVVTTVPNEPGVVRVQYQVEERPPAQVGQVVIIGNDVTQDRVIRRVLGLYPGQTLRYPELRIAERDLARLNIFESNPELGIRPTVTVIDPEGNSPIKDILVQVKETHTGSLMLGAGVNSDNGIVGSIVLNERNFDLFRFPTSFADILEGRAFRGAGQEFRIEAVPGNQLQRYTVSFREPFLFDRPYSLSASAYYYDRVYNEYTEGRAGGRVNIGHQLNKEWTITGGLRLENVNVSNVPFGAPVDYTSVVGNNLIAAPRVAATWDTRDSFMRPTEGGILDLSYEQVFGTFTFPILNAEASRYFTLWQRPDGSGRHVLAARSQVSWAGDDAPVFERFYAGGFRSIRGFQFRGVGPSENGFMTGGQFMFLNSIEYQLPIRANDQLYLVGFIDSGTVESKFELKNYRVSAGVGLRITVPMLGPVPIALDFGFPLAQASTDQTQLFSFWFGLYR